MRVPVIDGPKVNSRPVGTPYSDLNFDTGQEAVSRGLDQLAGGIDKAAHAVDRRAKEAADRANAIAANDALTQYQHDNTSELVGNASPSQADVGLLKAEGANEPREGFLQSRGRDAHERSADTLDRLEKRRNEIAQQLANDKQRQLFLQHSGSVFESSRTRVESHVAQQFEEAESASLEGRASETLRSITNDHANDKLADSSSKAVADTIRAFRAPYGDADAKVAAWNAKVADARLTQYLAGHDWKGAESLLGKVKEQIGPAEEAKFQRQITTFRTEQQEGALADKAVNAARIPGYAWLDPAKATEGIRDVPVELRKAVAQRIEDEIDLSEKVKKRAGQQKLNEVQAIYGATGNRNDPRIVPLRAWMLDPNNGAAGLWDNWSDEVNRESRSKGAHNSQMRSQQAAIDKEMLAEYRSLEPEERAAVDIESQYINRASRTTRLVMKDLQNKTKESIRSGAAIPEAEFHKSLDAEATNAGITSKKDVQDFKSDMVTWRLEWLEAHGGKAPSRKDFVDRLGEQLLYGDKGGLNLSKNKYKFQAEPGEEFVPFGADEQRSPLNKARAPAAGPGTQAGSGVQSPTPAPSSKKLPPGRYQDKKTGRYVVVDAQGNKRLE